MTKLRLLSSDKQTFEVDEEVARLSHTIELSLEDTVIDSQIPLPNVTGPILAKVLEFCQFYVNARKKTGDKAAKTEEEIRSWQAEFIQVDQSTLMDIVLAANYLNVKPLLDLSCQTVAEKIKGKTPEEIRVLYNLNGDSEPEDDEGPEPQGQEAKAPSGEASAAGGEAEAEATAPGARQEAEAGAPAAAAQAPPVTADAPAVTAEAPAAAAEEPAAAAEAPVAAAEAPAVTAAAPAAAAATATAAAAPAVAATASSAIEAS